jgi:hypothetical protein
MNEVAAVTRRLIEALLGEVDNCPPQVAKAFEAIAEGVQGQLYLYPSEGGGTFVPPLLAGTIVPPSIARAFEDNA